MSLRIGIARSTINPPLTITHAGWGAQTHNTADGIESDFWSTVLILKSENEVSVIVDLDLCLLLNEQADGLRTRLADALQISKSVIRISTTHTHAGPLLSRDSYESMRPIRESYLVYLMAQTVDAALSAMANQQQVTVGAGYGKCAVAKNRRQSIDRTRIVCGVNEHGLADSTLGVIRFDDHAGQTIASIVHYGMHPTLLGPENRLMSPEYPGVVKRTVESIVGGMCLFLQGAAGDVGPGTSGFVADISEMRRLGGIIGCEAAKTLLEVSTVRIEEQFAGIVESGASLGCWKRIQLGPNDDTLKGLTEKIQMNVSVPMPPQEAEQMALELQVQLDQLQKSDASGSEIQEVAFQLKRAQMVERRCVQFYGISHIAVEVTMIRVGDAVLIGLPVEPFSQIGISIRERSPFPYTLFSGYSNGWIGYLPVEAAYEGGGYEVETTPFAKGTAEQLIHDVVEMLHRMML